MKRPHNKSRLSSSHNIDWASGYNQCLDDMDKYVIEEFKDLKYEDPGNVWWRNTYLSFNKRIDKKIKELKKSHEK